MKNKRFSMAMLWTKKTFLYSLVPIYLLLAAIIFNSCKKEILIPKSKPLSNINLNVITYSDFLKDVNLNSLGFLKNKLNSSSTNNKLMSIADDNSLGNLSIYADSVQKFTTKDGVSYVFKMALSTKRAVSFRNLTIFVNKEGKTSAFIATYTPTKEWISAYKGRKSIPFKGEISFTPISLESRSLSQSLFSDASNNGSNGKVMSSGNKKMVVSTICYEYTLFQRIDMPCSSGYHWPGDWCDYYDGQGDGFPPYYDYGFVTHEYCFDIDLAAESGGGGTGTPPSNGGGSNPNPPGDYEPCDNCGTPPSVSHKNTTGGISKLSILPPNCCDEDNGGLYPLPIDPVAIVIGNLSIELGLTYEQKEYLLNNPNQGIAIEHYLQLNGRTTDNKDYAQWVAEYLYIHRFTINFGDFKNEYLPSAAIIAEPDANNWTDPDNVVLVDPDQTVYQQYQDSQPWPNVSSIINYEKFVPNRYIPGTNPPKIENCLVLAKEQLAKKGYGVSGYDETSSQIFQIYKEATGVNLTRTREGISYMVNSLSNGIPILVGVDVRSGAPSANDDKSTDHFIVIVGMGTDSKGKYFQFYDSSTNYAWLGASKENKLYFDSTTGKITGKTKSQYASRSGHHDFIITQIRKSIKK